MMIVGIWGNTILVIRNGVLLRRVQTGCECFEVKVSERLDYRPGYSAFIGDCDVHPFYNRSRNEENALDFLQSILDDVGQHPPDKVEAPTDDVGHALHEHVSKMIIFCTQAHKVGPADSNQL